MDSTRCLIGKGAMEGLNIQFASLYRAEATVPVCLMVENNRTTSAAFRLMTREFGDVVGNDGV